MIELLTQSSNQQRLLISAKRERVEVWQSRSQKSRHLGWLDQWQEWDAIETNVGPVPHWAESALAPIRRRAEKEYPKPTVADYLESA